MSIVGWGGGLMLSEDEINEAGEATIELFTAQPVPVPVPVDFLPNDSRLPQHAPVPGESRLGHPEI